MLPPPPRPPRCAQTFSSPAGSPSQISSQSYRHRAPGGGVVSGSRLKLLKSITISVILGAMIMKVHSRLLGYFSGKPGVWMTPVGAEKFLEHSGPEWKREMRIERLKCRGTFSQSDWCSLWLRGSFSVGGQREVITLLFTASLFLSQKWDNCGWEMGLRNGFMAIRVCFTNSSLKWAEKRLCHTCPSFQIWFDSCQKLF